MTEHEHMVFLFSVLSFGYKTIFFFSFPLVFFNHPASQDKFGDNFLKTFFSILNSKLSVLTSLQQQQQSSVIRGSLDFTF